MAIVELRFEPRESGLEVCALNLSPYSFSVNSALCFSPSRKYYLYKIYIFETVGAVALGTKWGPCAMSQVQTEFISPSSLRHQGPEAPAGGHPTADAHTQ